MEKLLKYIDKKIDYLDRDYMYEETYGEYYGINNEKKVNNRLYNWRSMNEIKKMLLDAYGK